MTDIDTIIKRIKQGARVADLAGELGVTPARVYQRLREAGRPIRSLTGRKRKSSDTRPIPSLGSGYRATKAGTIESCRKPRTGELGPDWHELTIRIPTDGLPIVSVGSDNSGTRRRLSVRRLLIEAWGEEEGERIFARLRRRLGV